MGLVYNIESPPRQTAPIYGSIKVEGWIFSGTGKSVEVYLTLDGRRIRPAQNLVRDDVRNAYPEEVKEYAYRSGFSHEIELREEERKKEHALKIFAKEAGSRKRVLLHTCLISAAGEQKIGLGNRMKRFCDYAELRGEETVSTNKVLRVKRMMLWPLQFGAFQSWKWLRRRILSFGNPIWCSSVTYCVRNLPAALFSSSFESNVDWETWERLSGRKGGFVYTPEIHILRRVHKASTTSVLVQSSVRRREDYEMFRKFWPEQAARILLKVYISNEKNYNFGE